MRNLKIIPYWKFLIFPQDRKLPANWAKSPDSIRALLTQILIEMMPPSLKVHLLSSSWQLAHNPKCFCMGCAAEEQLAWFISDLEIRLSRFTKLHCERGFFWQQQKHEKKVEIVIWEQGLPKARYYRKWKTPCYDSKEKAWHFFLSFLVTVKTLLCNARFQQSNIPS